jgi:hypothetical protein
VLTFQLHLSKHSTTRSPKAGATVDSGIVLGVAAFGAAAVSSEFGVDHIRILMPVINADPHLQIVRCRQQHCKPHTVTYLSERA